MITIISIFLRYHGGGTVQSMAVDSRFLISKQLSQHHRIAASNLIDPHEYLEDGTLNYYGIAGNIIYNY